MNPQQNPLSVYGMVAGFAGQMGCLLFMTIIGSLIIGLGLDRLLGTRPLFLFLFILSSIPLNIWMIFRFTRYKVKDLQTPSPQKEDTLRE